MKTKLLMLILFGIFSLNAQTTHQIFWKIGVNGAAASKTIEVGDTVEWIWDDTFPHTVSSKAGSSETFDSGSITGMGLIYSKTFNVIGTNDYQCNVHPGTMFGTITVQNSLSIDDTNLTKFSMYPNPSKTNLRIEFNQFIAEGKIEIFDLMGKQVLFKNLRNSEFENLNISNWSQGHFIIKVKSENGSQTKQFIKN